MAARKAFGKLGSKLAKGKAEIAYSPIWKTTIPAGLATPAPPLGTDLGARGINVAQFCKQFNSITDAIQPGVPLPTVVNIKPDRSFGIEIRMPPAGWFLQHAAGIRRVPEEFDRKKMPYVGRITVKHVYHIAEMKHKDPEYEGVPLHETCQLLVREALAMGMEVVGQLHVDEHQLFQEERKKVVAAELQAIEDAKQAAVLRTTT